MLVYINAYHIPNIDEDAGDNKNEDSTSSRRSTRIGKKVVEWITKNDIDHVSLLDCKRIVIGREDSVATLRRKVIREEKSP